MSSHHSSWNVSAYATTRETLIAYIDRACDPTLREPNLSLNLEIAELINHKKANTPREAAVELVRLINHRNAHVAMLALHASPLLDILVKNCGYPFHLQISTKDFLNELVRRFPERPPVFAPPPMAKILELVHEWKNTLCVHSKHKEDLVHIRDMHRLLSYKGYRFPDFDKRAHSVLNPSETLQTPDELEEEDRAAQAAKLQELIRRGTPKDLAAAQELMKIMSGAEPERRPDYEKQVQKELDRIQQRILLLNEMLNNAKPKERFVEGDAYDVSTVQRWETSSCRALTEIFSGCFSWQQIAQKCRHVQPKIQKWIEESAENDPGAIDRLLMMNDLINNILKRYEAFKAGDRTAVAEIDPTLGSSGGKPSKKVETSLIDFDFDEPRAGGSSSNPSSAPSNPMDDLSALSGLSLGVGAESSSAFASGPSSAQPYGSQAQQQPKVDPMSFFNSSSSSTNTSPRTSIANSNNNGMGGGLFFSNPTYQQQQQQAPTSTSNAFGAQPATSHEPISWASASTSNAVPRASTPSQPGVIQLGSGAGNAHFGPGSKSGGGNGGRASLTASTGKGPFGGQAMYGNSPPLPQLPMEANEDGGAGPGAGAGKKKDAFEDLLGDF
ncbi:BQ2448_2492 [Microbotryum intermedium]|uniref:BQ2448_2492 protein n=1 Tax=Microbotryum intermedium TaxID=269621 RepID=A0A238F6H3_9BASI|nr:BQ2448_2492 [Microbotryum intermedium]